MKVEHHGAVTAPGHTVLFATPEGSSTHFERALGVDSQAVIDTTGMEYGIEIIDQNDHRFWGVSSLEEMENAFRSPGSSRNWVLVEGPSVRDAEFANGG